MCRSAGALLLASLANAIKMSLLRSWQNFIMKMRKKMKMNFHLSPYPFNPSSPYTTAIQIVQNVGAYCNTPLQRTTNDQ